MYYDVLSVHSNTLAENGEIQPSILLNSTLAVSINQIADSFIKLAKERNYMVVENDKGQVLVIKRSNASIKDIIMQCLLPQLNDKTISGIKLSIITNKLQCRRKITVKGLRGNVEENHKFLAEFDSLMKHQKKGSFDQEDGDSNIDKTFIPSKPSEDDDEEESENNSNPFTLESTANYMFQKILCAQAYGVGKRVSEFIADFKNNYRNLEESVQLLPKPMEGIVAMVNEIVESLFSDFNYGKSETKSVMPYCKISVEKYIFGKLNTNLYSMYALKNNGIDQVYRQKRKQILENTSIIDVFKFLDSKRRYWLIQNENTFNQDLVENPSIRPYNDAIKELEKLKFSISPREKLKATMMMRSMMRGSVLDFHRGQEELASMDDELPIVIYIILIADVENLFTELSMVEDFVEMDPAIESEKRFLTNLRVAGEYISKEWMVTAAATTTTTTNTNAGIGNGSTPV